MPKNSIVPAHTLRFGMLTMPYPPWARLLATWREYEAMGFDTIWVCDHFVSASGQRPLFEAWTVLAALAAETEWVRFGTVVSCNAFRHPALLAKEIVTVDHISGGRLEVGLGTGWWAEEHAMYGFAFLPPATRIARFRESVVVLDRLLRGEVTTHDGDALRLREAVCRPNPIQRPRPPFVLAAQGPRMIWTVAPFVDTWVASFGLSPVEVAERGRALDAECVAIGRDPRGVRRAFLWAPWVQPLDPWESVGAFDEFVGRYRDAGVTDFIFDEPRTEQRPVLERVAAETLPRLRVPMLRGLT